MSSPPNDKPFLLKWIKHKMCQVCSKPAAAHYLKLEQVKNSVTDDCTKIRRTAVSYFRYGRDHIFILVVSGGGISRVSQSALVWDWSAFRFRWVFLSRNDCSSNTKRLNVISTRHCRQGALGHSPAMIVAIITQMSQSRIRQNHLEALYILCW